LDYFTIFLRGPGSRHTVDHPELNFPHHKGNDYFPKKTSHDERSALNRSIMSTGIILAFTFLLLGYLAFTYLRKGAM
jgi:hypothetical protein